MREWIWKFQWLALATSFWAWAQGGERLCSRLEIVPAKTIQFSQTERILLCGDPRNTSWNSLPENQVRFHLKAFLQDRGYFFPSFESTPQLLKVNLGEKTLVKKLEFVGAPAELYEHVFRKVIGEPLTPALLDSTKIRVRHKLQTLGYACPEIAVKAIASTGALIAEIDAGKKLRVIRADAAPVEDLSDEVPHRYRAFRLGSLYNPDYLAVTVFRTLEAGFAQSTHFTTRCELEGVELDQKFIVGAPRLVRIGFGVDTEQLLMGRAQWSHHRLGKMGSQIDLMASLSFRVQEFSAVSKWYFLPYPSRYYLRPSVQLRRNVEKYYEAYEGRLQFSPGMTWDGEKNGMEAQFGPALNFTDTVVGVGADSTKFLSFFGNASVQSHYFEFYRLSPQAGYEVKAETNLTFRNAFSPVNAQLIRLFFTKNWNILSLDPPWLVVSVRGGAQTTFTDEDPANSEILPVSFKSFLGGSSNLRGFGRQELPDKSGALTSFFTGVELRFTDLLPFKLQPIIFTDLGLTGSRTLKLEAPVFWSPGGGVRWESPIGAIRTTLSHGFLMGGENRPELGREHWQFYFIFGDEF